LAVVFGRPDFPAMSGGRGWIGPGSFLFFRTLGGSLRTPGFSRDVWRQGDESSTDSSKGDREFNARRVVTLHDWGTGNDWGGGGHRRFFKGGPGI